MNPAVKPVNMYFLALVLPTHLDEKIRSYKTWMKEKFACKVGLKSPAHITLIPPFWLEEKGEESLLQIATSIANGQVVFDVTTAGFSSFGVRTIFIAVAENEALQTLKQKTDLAVRNTDLGIKIDTRPFHPHITIATRDLHKKDFAEAWSVLQTKEFREKFAATGISLLKHNGSRWDAVFTAPFRNRVEALDESV